MKAAIICPRCIEVEGRKPEAERHKPQRLCEYEDVRGSGELYLWCKRCRRAIRIDLASISLDR